MMAPVRKARAGTLTRSWGQVEEEIKDADVVMASAPKSRCTWVAIDEEASRSFAEYNLQEEFEESRVAHLYGRRTDVGIHVDVLYEPPQEAVEGGLLPEECIRGAAAAESTVSAAAEAARVRRLAVALGLERHVFSHTPPDGTHPRWRTPQMAPPILFPLVAVMISPRFDEQGRVGVLTPRAPP